MKHMEGAFIWLLSMLQLIWIRVEVEDYAEN